MDDAGEDHPQHDAGDRNPGQHVKDAAHPVRLRRPGPNCPAPRGENPRGSTPPGEYPPGENNARVARSTRLGVLAVCLAVLAAALPAAATTAPSGPPAGSLPRAGSLPPAGSLPTAAVTDPWSKPADVGKPYPGTTRGVFTFRGNPTRTYLGSGPVPRTTPRRLWRYPVSGAMCAVSEVAGEPIRWCGTGWTGQPAVVEREGRTWLIVGAYDNALHFLDASTGEPILPSLPVGDLIKGSVTVDPDGYPLVYVGSRDNYLRVVAFDGPRPRVLWRLSAYDVSPVRWNNDWDGSPLVLRDHLFIGGENSHFHIVALNRSYDRRGTVQVDPRLLFNVPSWDAQLEAEAGTGAYSIEGSVAIWNSTAYFANSAGLVQGWDISGIRDGRPPRRVFRFWTGDDTDATVVVDELGHLYVGAEFERGTARSRAVGQMMKLDPSRPDDPLLWSVKDQGRIPGGIWATPALHGDIVIFATDGGRVLGLDRATGAQRWELRLPGPLWQSPVVVDNVLIMGDCAGWLHGFDVTATTPRDRTPSNPQPADEQPRRLWRVRLDGCIESTPAVWQGRIYVGTRGGGVHAVGLPRRSSAT